MERDKYQDQYSALFKQLQQSLDTVQLLQQEKERLQEQIREIQRLSGGGGSSSQAPELLQVCEVVGLGESTVVSAGTAGGRPGFLRGLCGH